VALPPRPREAGDQARANRINGGLVPDEIERGNAVVIARDGFAIDDARARAQAGERFDNQREAASHVIAGAAIEPHAVAILACDDAKSVVLDFVQPLAEDNWPERVHDHRRRRGRADCRHEGYTGRLVRRARPGLPRLPASTGRSG